MEKIKEIFTTIKEKTNLFFSALKDFFQNKDPKIRIMRKIMFLIILILLIGFLIGFLIGCINGYKVASQYFTEEYFKTLQFQSIKDILFKN